MRHSSRVLAFQHSARHNVHIPRGTWAATNHRNGNSDHFSSIDEPSNTKDEATIIREEGGYTTILQRSSKHIVAYKPSGVVCHHSGWTGSRSKHKHGDKPEMPMLQRVRDAVYDVECRSRQRQLDNDNNGGEDQRPIKKRVNLIHRLDRGASGALLFAYADDDYDDYNNNNTVDNEEDDRQSSTALDENKDNSIKSNSITTELINAMAHPNTTKTYIALVRGEGILHGEDLTTKGWFTINRPIKDEDGILRNATTIVNFIAGQAETSFDRPRVSVVLARPQQGRWHQIRRHLNGLSHPIIGDSTHGVSTINREWREGRGIPAERILLHLGRLDIIPTKKFPNGIHVTAPMPYDILTALQEYAPNVLVRSLPIIEKELGIPLIPILDDNNNDDDDDDDGRYEVGKWCIPDALLHPKDMSVATTDDNVGIVLDTIDILESTKYYVIVMKPPVVVVHNSKWTLPSNTVGRGGQRRLEGMPMLQRVRNKMDQRRVNLIHRLDRGASGCLLLSFADSGNQDKGQIGGGGCEVTKTLIESMQHATKTYIALCDGDGTWNGINYLDKGWFTFTNPVKDESGNIIEYAETDIKFVSSSILPPVEKKEEGSDTIDYDKSNNLEGRKVCIILARPKTGRWHQIRQHLASGTIGHAIIGDSSHGRSRTNRIWKKDRHLMKERVCLHLYHLQVPPSEYVPSGIDVTCPLSSDLVTMLEALPMELLDEARPILAKEGIHI
jgi:23S rRNA-/tRNA-specific pseudouridylate synthase